MKWPLVIGSVLGGAVVGAVAFYATASAQAAPSAIGSPAHSEHIRSHCQSAQVLIKRVIGNDTLARVTGGRLYDLILTHLMANLNSRLAVNRMDVGRLPAITVDYEARLKLFREHYIAYEHDARSASQVDCVDRPLEFYQLVAAARDKRAVVRDDVRVLRATLEEYRSEFGRLLQPLLDNGGNQ